MNKLFTRTNDQRCEDTYYAWREAEVKTTQAMYDLQQQLLQFKAMRIDFEHTLRRMGLLKGEPKLNPTICDKCHDTGMTHENAQGRTWQVMCSCQAEEV